MGSLKATEPLKRPERQSGICQGIESLSGIESSDVYESEGHHLNWARKRNTVNLSPFYLHSEEENRKPPFPPGSSEEENRKPQHHSPCSLLSSSEEENRKPPYPPGSSEEENRKPQYHPIAVRKRKTANLISTWQFGRGKP